MLRYDNISGKGLWFLFKITWARLYVSTIRSFSDSWIINGFAIRVTLQVPHIEQELLNYPSVTPDFIPVFSGVRVTQSLVLWGVFCTSLFCCPFCFGHLIVCPSSIYGFWLPLWYLQFKLFFQLFSWREPLFL